MAKILITGGSGFLGKRLASLLRPGHYVEAGHAANLNLCNYEDTYELLSEGWDRVYHLAAKVGGIGANQAKPADFWSANIQMGMNVLDAAARLKIPKLVMVGTTCSYPKYTPTPFKEDNLFFGFPEETNAPYGIAKRALLVGAGAYRNQYGLNVVTAVPTNLYGPGDSFSLDASHVIPAMIRKFHEAKKTGADVVHLWGTGNPSRDFLYVDDAANGLVRMMETYNEPEPINLGSGREIKIHELASMIAEIVGYTGCWLWDSSKPDGQPRRVLDVSRAEAMLGWRPRTRTEEGLRTTYDWFRHECESGRIF